jgi:hypothetical protein
MKPKLLEELARLFLLEARDTKDRELLVIAQEIQTRAEIAKALRILGAR